jgi:hypothetical protein
VISGTTRARLPLMPLSISPPGHQSSSEPDQRFPVGHRERAGVVQFVFRQPVGVLPAGDPGGIAVDDAVPYGLFHDAHQNRQAVFIADRLQSSAIQLFTRFRFGLPKARTLCGNRVSGSMGARLVLRIGEDGESDLDPVSVGLHGQALEDLQGLIQERDTGLGLAVAQMAFGAALQRVGFIVGLRCFPSQA